MRRFFFLGVWLFLVLGGWLMLIKYSSVPGRDAQAPPSWPTKSSLPFQMGLARVVLFLHPQCACSRATLGELERLLPALEGKASVIVVFTAIAGDSRLVKMAAALPEVKVVQDISDRETTLFGAKTSGEVLYYSARGRLAFRGGITPARSHMGDSQGRDAILGLIEQRKNTVSSTPTFGCALRKYPVVARQ